MLFCCRSAALARPAKADEGNVSEGVLALFVGYWYAPLDGSIPGHSLSENLQLRWHTREIMPKEPN